MSEDNLSASSFGDPSARPLTPKQTPKSIASSPSLVFETPKLDQGSFAETGSLTPLFAEEYSVFDVSPGNLRGTQGIFPDFAAATNSATLSVAHRRLLSTESLVAVETEVHDNHSSSNLGAQPPPADAGHQPPSVPNPSAKAKVCPLSNRHSQLSPGLAQTPTSSKRARRGTVTNTEPTQIMSPPPTARKGERKLAPKPSMQNDPGSHHADFVDPSQQDMTAFMGNVGDLFGYPMSAPAASTQPNFWDSSTSMGVDFDFTTSATILFQPPTTSSSSSSSSSHRHTGSFDWNSEVQLFQDPTIPPASKQENVQPSGLPRNFRAPKSSVSDTIYNKFGHHSPSATHPASTDTATMDDPFCVTTADGVAVDPGLLFSRPQSAAMDATFGGLVQSGSAEAAIVRSGKAQAADVCRSSSIREVQSNTKGPLPDRAIASSPVRALKWKGLSQSVGESRRKKPVRKGSLPLLAPAAAKPASGPGLAAGKSTGLFSGRRSPFKGQPRLTGLTSIPETSPHPVPRASLRLFIDAHGRARTETTTGGGRSLMARSRSSQDLATGRGYCSSPEGEDSEDSDDEPIIIPSRTRSFNASFALPDVRKPVGSIFHSSMRSGSERSSSYSANEGESEAETVVMNEKPGRVGDATSELRKVVQDRQNRSLRLRSSKCQRILKTTNLCHFAGGIISPTSLTESSYGPDSDGVRCVCHKSKTDEGEGFMVQCESCEMWLHGKCINIARRTMPNVYICGFCAETRSVAGGWARDVERSNALGIRTA